MFIELTDHLRCVEDHPEQFLVLLPDRVEQRRVVTGSLGCPVCGRVYPIADGVARFGTPAVPTPDPPGLAAATIYALLGITGPGGYVSLIGSAGGAADELAAVLPQVHFALVNPPAGRGDAAHASVLEAVRLPLKGGSMRGVVVGPELAADPGWVAAAGHAVLPGNRFVVAGDPMEIADTEVLASAPGAWVGRRVTGR